MGDTTAAADRIVRWRLLALPGEQRLILAADMFDMACTLVLASLPEDLPPRERRRRLCERLYGSHVAQCYAAAVERTEMEGERKMRGKDGKTEGTELPAS